MRVHEAELVALLISLCDGDIPTTETLGPGSRRVGAEEAWRILRRPHLGAGQIVVPVREGALLLVDPTHLNPAVAALSRRWRDRAVGVLAAIYEQDVGRLSE
ncbi:hypothetical protein [Deinococcus sedimenti]|nr:hypothetical protein [Deinococcus sedimenti]